MAFVAILLGYGFWTGLNWITRGRVRPWGMLENNISQTACSSAALVGSAGLVASVPALAIVTGITLPWHALAVWILSVCLVGIMVAVVWRRQLLLRDHLTFPVGTACAEMLREMHTRGREALARITALIGGALAAGVVFLLTLLGHVGALTLPLSLRGIQSSVLTFSFQPSLFFYGIGGLIGIRAAASLLIGALLAYGVLAPAMIHSGGIRLTVTEPLPVLPLEVEPSSVFGGQGRYVADKGRLEWRGLMSAAQRDTMLAASADPAYRETISKLYARSQPEAAAPTFGDLITWLVWPGATLMVVSALASFALSVRSALRSWGRSGGTAAHETEGDLSRRWAGTGLGAVLLLSVFLQVKLFGIAWPLAAAGVLLAFVLAIIATRVSADTGITPVGPMGKLAQLSVGALAPQSAAANLMAANVAAGAASQSADLLDDLKCGYLVGTPARLQALAQTCGAVAGALAGSAVYLLLLPHPLEQVGSRDWPTPGVLPLKAVAELFRLGFHVIPPGTGIAMAIAAVVALLLVILERTLPSRFARFVPSAAGLGSAFVIPAGSSIALFLGGLGALVLSKTSPAWTRRFLVALCAGIVAGDSLLKTSEALVKALQTLGH